MVTTIPVTPAMRTARAAVRWAGRGEQGTGVRGSACDSTPARALTPERGHERDFVPGSLVQDFAMACGSFAGTDIRVRGDPALALGTAPTRRFSSSSTRSASVASVEQPNELLSIGIDQHGKGRVGRGMGTLDFNRAAVAGDPLAAAGLLVAVRLGQRQMGSVRRRRSRFCKWVLRQWRFLRRAWRAR